MSDLSMFDIAKGLMEQKFLESLAIEGAEQDDQRLTFAFDLMDLQKLG